MSEDLSDVNGPDETTYESLLDGLSRVGWACAPGFMSADYTAALLAEAQTLWQAGAYAAAGIGRGAQRDVRQEIRSDHILWLAETDLTPLQQVYWRAIDQLRLAINRAFFLSLRTFEAHLATYPAGAFYKRHLDQHRRTDRRRISCVFYLNPAWEPAAGGQLRLYPSADAPDEWVDVQPYAGTLACFRSDTIYHEVLPAARQRYSLTGWLCVDDAPFG